MNDPSLSYSCDAAQGYQVKEKVFPNGEPERSVKLYAILDDQSNRTLGGTDFFDIMGISAQEAQKYTLSSCAGRVSVFGRRASGFR